MSSLKQTLFAAVSYREFLRKEVERRKEIGETQVSYGRMADACRIQKSFLSRVLAGEKADLSSDQLYAAGVFLGLSQEYLDFLLDLKEWERCTVPHRRRVLEKKIREKRADALKSEASLELDEAEAAAPDLTPFYLSPQMQVLHAALALTRLQGNPRLIAKALRIDEPLVSKDLSQLESMKLATRNKLGVWSQNEVRLHLTSVSPIFPGYRLAMRAAALSQAQSASDPQAYQFAAMFTCDEAARVDIRAYFLEFLSRAQQRAGRDDVKPTLVVQMGFDLFAWLHTD